MPKRRRSPEKHYQISKAEKQNLDRFGCTFGERTGVFYVDWRGKDVAQAANAEIFARLVYIKNERGPIVLLACEISAVRPLPHYCYFPFDLRKQVHRKYLSRFAETGEIRFRFLANKETFDLTHRLTPYLRVRTSEIYAEILQEWGTYKSNQYDFDGALQLLERHLRVPFFLDRVLLEGSLHEIKAKITEAVQTVSNENRELARRIVGEAAGAFLPYYQSNGKALFERLDGIRLGVTCMIDLRRIFADSPGGLTEFLSDGLAGTFSRKELEGLSDVLKLVLSFIKLPFREQSSSPTEAPSTIPVLPPGLVDLFQSMVVSGIPKNAASRVFELIGLEVGGKPGRPPRDYSAEYNLKASGLSWTEVTRQRLRESSELREEFGGREFESLTFEEREGLMNRIRQGVTSYAERVDMPLPPRLAAVQPTFAEGEQKTPKNSPLQRIPPDKLPS